MATAAETVIENLRDQLRTVKSLLGPEKLAQFLAEEQMRDILLARAKPLVTDEGWAELTYLPLEELRQEVFAIQRFVPDPHIGK